MYIASVSEKAPIQKTFLVPTNFFKTNDFKNVHEVLVIEYFFDIFPTFW